MCVRVNDFTMLMNGCKLISFIFYACRVNLFREKKKKYKYLWGMLMKKHFIAFDNLISNFKKVKLEFGWIKQILCLFSRWCCFVLYFISQIRNQFDCEIHDILAIWTCYTTILICIQYQFPHIDYKHVKLTLSINFSIYVAHTSIVITVVSVFLDSNYRRISLATGFYVWKFGVRLQSLMKIKQFFFVAFFQKKIESFDKMNRCSV